MSEYDVELHERVARIETEVEHIDKLVSARAGKLECIERKLDNIEKDLERYRGTVGAVLLVTTAIISFFKLFWGDITNFFGKQ